MKLYVLVVFLFISSLIDAQNYEGTIGKYPIFISLDKYEDDKSISGFYFYKSQLQNISLDGDFDDSGLFLYERFSEKEDLKEFFSLKEVKGKLIGIWQNKSVSLPVILDKTPINFNQFKLDELQFIRDSVAAYGTKELVWFSEKFSKQSLFRLGNGFTKEQREFVNKKLDSIQTEYAMTRLDCNWAETKIEIELISNQFLSFSEYSYIECGGAHPSSGTNGYNFDLKNNTLVDNLLDIYPNLQLSQLIKDKYENNEDLQEECGYFDDESRWNYYSWVFTEEGVVVSPYFPHVMRPCETGFLLTHKELQKNKVNE